MLRPHTLKHNNTTSQLHDKQTPQLHALSEQLQAGPNWKAWARLANLYVSPRAPAHDASTVTKVTTSQIMDSYILCSSKRTDDLSMWPATCRQGISVKNKWVTIRKVKRSGQIAHPEVTTFLKFFQTFLVMLTCRKECTNLAEMRTRVCASHGTCCGWNTQNLSYLTLQPCLLHCKARYTHPAVHTLIQLIHLPATVTGCH